MKMKKLLAPFLIAGLVFSAGGNSVGASTLNDSNNHDWDKAWESFETEKYPSSIILSDTPSGVNTLAGALDYTNGKTSLSYSSGKVKSTGTSQDGGLLDIISAQTSISTMGLSYIQGNYDSTTVLTSNSKATSTITTTDLNGNNTWSGLTYHTVNRAASGITFTGYTSDSGVW